MIKEDDTSTCIIQFSLFHKKSHLFFPELRSLPFRIIVVSEVTCVGVLR